MRIQNNITAMNTHRMYTINNDNVAKSAEKLSSGYRINRAGDDAAGLAISEKMRAQIRGLNMATKNSQDAISLVQTAEGALQETHSMLQRMNELAVQAATGTNEGFDRTQAAKEFEQLKREINDVAEQTNFNNMKILDGSLSYEGYVRSAATAGVNATVDTQATVSDPAVSSEVTTSAQAGTAGAKAALNLNASATLTAPSGLGATQNANWKLVVELNGNQYEVKDQNGKAILTDATSNINTKLWANGKVTVEDANGNRVELTMDANGTKLEAASEADLDLTGATVKMIGIDPSDKSNTTSSSVMSATNTAAAPNVVNGVAATTPNTPTAMVQTIKVDQSKLQDGDSIKVGDKTYTFYAKNGTDATGGAIYKDADGNEIKSNVAADSGSSFNIVFDADTPGDAASQLAGLLASATAGPTTPTGTDAKDGVGAPVASSAPNVGAGGVTATAAGDTITMTVTWTGAAGTNTTADSKLEVDKKFAAGLADAYKVEVNGGGSKESMKSTVEFDIAKMKDGDKFTITAGSKSLEVTFSANDTRKGFMDKVRDAAEKAGFGEVKGNALIVEDAKAEVTLDWNQEELNKNTNAIRIQVGANENEQLALSIDSMNTAGLGLDDAFLTVVGQSTDENIDSAGAAITAVKAAINKVSDQRATLGAMQNRLDHKIANLKVSSENLSAAESRIRDVDMAQEMTNFTKNNILSQAATAMLAQANALPQNVLSLLG